MHMLPKFLNKLRIRYDAGIVNFCHNLKAIALPLEGNAVEGNFKVYQLWDVYPG